MCLKKQQQQQKYKIYTERRKRKKIFHIKIKSIVFSTEEKLYSIYFTSINHKITASLFLIELKESIVNISFGLFISSKNLQFLRLKGSEYVNFDACSALIW